MNPSVGLREGWIRRSARARSVMLEVTDRAPSNGMRGGASPTLWTPHPGPEDVKRVNEVVQEEDGTGDLTGPVPGHNQTPLGISAPPTAAKSQAADRALL